MSPMFDLFDGIPRRLLIVLAWLVATGAGVGVALAACWVAGKI